MLKLAGAPYIPSLFRGVEEVFLGLALVTALAKLFTGARLRSAGLSVHLTMSLNRQRGPEAEGGIQLDLSKGDSFFLLLLIFLGALWITPNPKP